MEFPRALLGIGFFVGVAWLLSRHKGRFPARTVIGGVLLQIAIAALILRTERGRALFEGLAAFVSKLVSMAQPGAEIVFGGLARPDTPVGFVFAFAGTGLIVIIFFSALMGVLYHLGVMQVLIWVLAKVMSVTMGLSGGEAMAAAANIFVGQTEAPLFVRPYLGRMTLSELNSLMTAGFGTIAGSVMAVYMTTLGGEIAPHLITASVMSAPAAFVLSKTILPETEVSATAGAVELRIERSAGNLIEAAANGTTDGLKLWLNVCAMLIAFTALVALLNWPLGALGESLGVEGGLSLARLFGWVLAPVAWLMGIEGWRDSQLVGSLMGIQLSTNEFVAYLQMKEYLPSETGPGLFEHARSAKISAYALCGFANFASIGIQIGGIAALAPERKADLSRLALRAMLGGAAACWMTATVAGMFL